MLRVPFGLQYRTLVGYSQRLWLGTLKAMDITTYLERREKLKSESPHYRVLCRTCLQPDFSCYCTWLKPISCDLDFVILIHPIEVHRRIATGRMAHLCLKGSRLIMGHDFSNNTELNDILSEPSRHPVLLYPGVNSLNLTPVQSNARRSLFPLDKRLTVLVVDGTWATARKMVRLSSNINKLPRICFTPQTASNFRVRRQPRAECYSTIEAIHQTIDLFDNEGSTREHDHLLEVFEKMVNRQLELAHSLW